MTKEMRCHPLDTLKLLLAMFVVFLHTESAYHDYIVPVIIVAVPTFFMISGYCIYTPQNLNGRIWQAAKRIAIICLWSSLLYYVAKAVMGGDIALTPVKCKNWLLYNDPPFAFHLWYLYAYLYTLVVVACCHKRLLFILAVPLAVLGVCLGRYSEMLGIMHVHTRNFLFTGIPCFVIGLLLAKHRARILHSRSWVVCILMLLSILLSYCEMLLLRGTERPFMGDLYFGTMPFAVLLIVACVSFSAYRNRETALSRFSKKYTLHIYVFHIMIASLLHTAIAKSGCSNCMIVQYTFPLMVFAATIAFIKIMNIGRKYIAL